MDKQTDQTKLAQQMNEDIAQWATRFDEAKVQLHLGAKEVQEKMQPHLDRLEQELSAAKQQLKQLDTASEGARSEIEQGLSASMKTMQQAFEKAKEHFSDTDKA